MKGDKPRVLVFASGAASGGGSGFEALVEAARTGVLNADIVGVVSNHEKGGVYERATKLGIPFIYFPKPWGAEEYQKIANTSQADFFALSGWLKLVMGLGHQTRFNPKTVFNIHPGPLPRFGGVGMFGHHIHEAVIEAFKKGEITHTAISMHFVTPEFDKGPIFLNFKIKINDDDTPETLGARVNKWEHTLQPKITNLVVTEQIKWDGISANSLKLPSGYAVNQF